MSIILSDFLVRKPEGYYCRYGDFFIDAGSPVAHNVVSHAHGDHASSGHDYVYCTNGTALFMSYRYKQNRKDSYQVKLFNGTFKIGPVEITFLAAGHILGSAQILMEYQGVRYLYTGDYKLQADETCELIEVQQADVLITESTFANPEVIHPDPIQEIKKLEGHASNILLGTYVLGKAQRITDLINRYCPERRVLVHSGILPYHRLYDEHGLKKMTYEPYNRREMKQGEQNKVYLVPPMTFNSYFRATKVLRAFASGWKRLQAQNDIELYISDHVDWNDILHYIKMVDPKEVWTLHGDGTILKSYFGDRLMVRDVLSA
ncbi:MBL fold metallo-hydrolase [Sphingobacterium sp. BIGb0165]|uniref:MBL fold metallo-hydrolase n=1 Tax=Sphingobacterium sp. BIGb0165 TaxID=2940615 RepID=UPI0021676893|nr:MBL fold metallo-hydrolase [Sphingobacterium sp. BIGb0165]MCS4223956.1 putative mRNA 3-end processing factor [Sphingobacterium sp. BIGb0165]